MKVPHPTLHFCRPYMRSLPLILSHRLMYGIRGEQRCEQEKVGESMYKGKGVTGPLTIYVFIMHDLKREKSDNQFITGIITISSIGFLIYA